MACPMSVKQAGGRKRRATKRVSRKGKKSMRKSKRVSRKSRKTRRKHRGGNKDVAKALEGLVRGLK